MKKVVIDLAASPLLGTAAKSVWLIQGYLDQGYRLTIINKSWSEDMPMSGLTFDSGREEFEEPSWTQLWDPSTHPDDFFKNLVLPSFKGVAFRQAKKKTFITRVMTALRTLCDPRYISNHDFVLMHMSNRERREYRNQKIREILAGKSGNSVLSVLYFLGQFYISSKVKIKTVPSAFRYKLSSKLHTSQVKDFIESAKSENEKYILVSVLWDETKKFERREFLRGGPHYDPIVFQHLLNYVAELDKRALAGGKFRFLLASKKAVDWEQYLNSDFLDLRGFEEHGFCLSQSLFIAQELAVATINWPSTYTTWITNCADIEHLTWMDDRDTSPWARNSLHERPVSELLSRIDAV